MHTLFSLSLVSVYPFYDLRCTRQSSQCNGYICSKLFAKLWLEFMNGHYKWMAFGLHCILAEELYLRVIAELYLTFAYIYRRLTNPLIWGFIQLVVYSNTVNAFPSRLVHHSLGDSTVERVLNNFYVCSNVDFFFNLKN